MVRSPHQHLKSEQNQHIIHIFNTQFDHLIPQINQQDK